MAEIQLLNLTDLSAGAEAGGFCGPDGCACGMDESAAAGHGASAAPSTATYQVTGMTCGHCVAAVTKELSAIPGVAAVDIDLVAGGASTVTIGSGEPISADAVRAAIEEAGYELA